MNQREQWLSSVVDLVTVLRESKDDPRLVQLLEAAMELATDPAYITDDPAPE